MQQSVNQLSILTGMSARTIQRRLEGVDFEVVGKAHKYESREVLPILYGAGKSESDSFDLTEERARLAHHQANIAALDEKVKEKSLIPFDVVVERWQAILANFRAKALALPSSLASTCANADRDAVQDKSMTLVRQMLEELAGDVDY